MTTTGTIEAARFYRIVTPRAGSRLQPATSGLLWTQEPPRGGACIMLFRRSLGLFLVWAAATLLACTTALAEKRVALVIGNSGYQKVKKLTNPANDAQAVSAVFKGAGF